jgi:sensor domain CHASE-containing protein
VKRDPAKAEPHFQEKETLKTHRRFENSHVRVAQQQFRTAYRIDRHLFGEFISPNYCFLCKPIA